MQPRELQRRAFDNIYDRFPFLASIVASWEITWTQSIPTAATDGPHLFINPDFMQSGGEGGKPLRISEATDLFLHEAGHVFLGHHMRMEERHPKIWNIAADLALNDHVMVHFDSEGTIRRQGCFPGENMFRDLERGQTAETYFKAIYTDQPPEYGKGVPQKGQKGDSEEGQGEAESDPNGSDEEGESSDSGEQSGGQSGKQKEGQQGASGKSQKQKSDKGDENQDGQGGADQSQPERPEPTYHGQSLPNMAGEVLPHPALEGTEEEREEAEQQWEQQVARGINDAKSQGNLPGWVEELGASLYAKKSNMDWKMYLRRFMTRYLPVRRSYSRPNRRHSYRDDTVLPGRNSREASPGCILTDTSGSMNQWEMDAAITEAGGILSVFQRCEVTVVQADTRLIEEAEVKYKRWDFPIRTPVVWHGRGGTNLSGAIEKVGRSGKYKWLVVVSDMEWEAAHAVDPKIPVLWLATRINFREGYNKPKFGMVVPLTVERPA